MRKQGSILNNRGAGVRNRRLAKILKGDKKMNVELNFDEIVTVFAVLADKIENDDALSKRTEGNIYSACYKLASAAKEVTSNISPEDV